MSIDAKQRLAIPAKFRNLVKGDDAAAWVVMPWHEGMVLLFPATRFAAMAEARQSGMTPSTENPDADADFFGMSERLDVDSAGRVTLPKSILDSAKFAAEVVVVGAGKRLEIRDRAAWLASKEERLARIPAAAQKVDVPADKAAKPA